MTAKPWAMYLLSIFSNPIYSLTHLLTSPSYIVLRIKTIIAYGFQISNEKTPEKKKNGALNTFSAHTSV
jgi:hypothetical protein